MNRALPALLVPLILDVWYWVGPRISIHPLVEWVRKAFDPTTWQQLRTQVDPLMLSDRLFDLKYAGQIEGRLPFWQRIYALEPAASAPMLFRPATWYVGGFLTLFAAVIAINIVLTLLTAIYLIPLADIIRGGTAPRSWIRRVLRAWVSQLGVVGIILTFFIVIGVPLLTVAGVLTTVAPALGNFMAVFSMAVLLWIVFTASFAYDAIVVSDAGPIGAMLASLLIIRKSFWGAVGLYLLNFFILAGLSIIWDGLMGSLPGLIVAMLSSAYVGAGLAAAHLVFYRDRLPVSAARKPESQA